jgi:predicted CXXCH cytochrome family protein
VLLSSAFLVLAYAVEQAADVPGQLPEPPATQPTSSAPASQPVGEEAFRGGLIGSKHDFTQGGWYARDLCLPCHTAHLPRTRPALLDHRPITTQPAPLYQPIGVDMDSTSLMCLGCHNGVVAPDVYTSAHATRLIEQLGSAALGASGLTGHPIGVKYPLEDVHFQPLAAVRADGVIRVPRDRVQCISCHDPHNSLRIPGMLVKSNDRSQLCLSCHRR